MGQVTGVQGYTRQFFVHFFSIFPVQPCGSVYCALLLSNDVYILCDQMHDTRELYIPISSSDTS
jgi:hypothetical protein